MKKQKLLMHVYAVITVNLWALGYVMTRVAVGYFTPEAVAFLRYFVAAVTMLIFALIKKMRPPKLREIPLFFLGGAAGFAVYVYTINIGTKTMTASAVSFIITASPIITAVLARILLREKMGLIGWLSVICAFSGICVITFFNGGFALNSGAVWICFAAVLISIYNIYQRKLLIRYTPLEITAYCIIAGALLLSVFAPLSLSQFLSAAPAGIASVIVLGVFSAGIAYLCWAYALSKAGKTSEVTNYMFVTPILTTFMGFVMINEAPGISAYIGGALVLAGVVLISRRGVIKPEK